VTNINYIYVALEQFAYLQDDVLFVHTLTTHDSRKSLQVGSLSWFRTTDLRLIKTPLSPWANRLKFIYISVVSKYSMIKSAAYAETKSHSIIREFNCTYTQQVVNNFVAEPELVEPVFVEDQFNYDGTIYKYKK
jgi:hypothetical protein